MPRISSHGKSGGRIVVLILVVLTFAFTPVSDLLLRLVNGSFSPAPYSSLSLTELKQAEVGVARGKPISLLIENHTGRVNTYQWDVTQNGALIHHGVRTLRDGQSSPLLVTTTGARVGKLRIDLHGTDIFVTVNIIK